MLEFRKCNDSNILIETNNYERRLFQNKDGINLLNLDSKVSYINNRTVWELQFFIYFSQTLSLTWKDKWEFIDSTYYVKNINDVIEDSSSNPYMMNAEMKEMLLKLDKRVS